MTYSLFIDDERLPPLQSAGYIVVRNYNQAIQHMAEWGCPVFISFDHDLGENSKTGYDIANWIIDKDIVTPDWISADFTFYVHSQNPVGAENIRRLLTNYLAFRGSR